MQGFVAHVASPYVTKVRLGISGMWVVCWNEWHVGWYCVVCLCEKCMTSRCWRRAAPARYSGVGVVGGAPRGARIDCWHSHTDLEKVTDAGLKAFSAALGSSTTITTVMLYSKSE